MNTPSLQAPLTVAGIRVSRHAIFRSRERVHWSREAAERMAFRALVCGTGTDSSRGIVRRYLQELVAAEPGCVAKLYGEFTYIFACAAEAPAVLVTLYRAPAAVIRAHLGRRLRASFWQHASDN